MKSIILIILDGWGYAPAWGGNAITESKTPNFDKLWKNYPHTTLQASGSYVGLPGHEMGNSEVGHLNLGAGRVVSQDIKRINKSIIEGNFFNNKVLLRAIQEAKRNNKKLHLLGLVSDGGVHSHIKHLYALLKLAQKEKLSNVYIHLITDGRDSDPLSGITHLTHLVNKIKELDVGRIATICGRYYAMDRDSKFDRTNLAYEAIVMGVGQRADDPQHAISESYKNGISDEFIKPIILDKNGLIEDGDSVICFNFRSDRARQITSFLVDKNFKKFRRKKILNDLFFVTMVPYYDYDLGLPIHPAFSPEVVKMPLAQVVSEANLKQFHVAETEKYAHVTFFFNGAREKPFEGEKRILIPSPKVPTYDLKPQMSAKEVTSETIKAIKSQKYGFILINFANPDMVGHTGVFEAAVKAVETIDESLGRLMEEIKKQKMNAIITADHGNVETMIDINTGEPYTEHTTNPVPFILFNNDNLKILPNAALSNVAPTILDLMDLKKPILMNSESLIAKDGESAKDPGIIEYRV
ncbi:2,3-bisphosphoglycerate-independent phosphoglycerate mutase [Patescibacteria group bacterium]|nr:2,3-bisphosphoglycerate-independent phosphoglycerate mutase [Patescibacteria group bacterium]